MKIYLGDLKHSISQRSQVVPLNIATLASAINDNFGNKVSTKLFLCPQKLISEIKSNPPDAIALSNYCWNSRLSLRILRLAKEKKPDILTIMGGPHVRLDQIGLYSFLKENLFIDAYIPFEGEVPFVSLIGKCLEKKSNNIKALGNIQGIFFNIDDYKFKRVNYHKLKGNQSLHPINKYTSPYLNGMLDEFLDDPQISPLLESNRGCPYLCTFCAWGIGSGNKLIKKNLDLFLKEMWYAGKRSKADIWFLTDGNFGILKDDVIIAKNFIEISNKYGNLKQVHFNTAKRQPERVYEISNMLGELSQVNIAVQSFDPEVVKKIKRKNLDYSEISNLLTRHQEKGRTVTTDLLVPNSGETLTSHLNSIRTFFDLGFDNVATQIIRILPGTEMESDENREKYGVKTKWRTMDAGYGEYENEFIFEADENIMGTKDLSVDEMHSIKKVHFLVNLFWGIGVGKPLLQLVKNNRINPLDVIMDIIKDEKSQLSQKILTPLQKEFAEEWFDTKEDLIRHFSDPAISKKILMGKKEFKKLNIKYLVKLILDKDLLVETVKTIRECVCSKIKLQEQIVKTVFQISLDCFRIDFLKGQLNKSISYKIDHKYFNYLKDIKIIPENVDYKNGGFLLEYQFPKQRSINMNHRLQENNFLKNREKGLYSAFVGYSAWFLYNIKKKKVSSKKYFNKKHVQENTNSLIMTT